MTTLRTLGLLATLLPFAAAAQPAGEEIGSWRLACVADRMTGRTACTLRHRDWVERPGTQPGLALEVIERGGRLVPAVTARDLALDGAGRGVLALTGAAQLRFDGNTMMDLPCGLEGRSLVCAPRASDAARAAEELPAANRALVRMAGLGSGATSATEPAELRLASTREALERLRRIQPPGPAAPPAASEGMDLREMLNRLQRFLLQ